MKPSINKITLLLNDDLLEKCRLVKEKMHEAEHLEMTSSEGYANFKVLFDQLKNSIDKAHIDRVSLNRRNNIIAALNNIKQAIDILDQYGYVYSNYQSQQYFNQYIQNIHALKEAVDDAKLFEMSKSFGNFYHATERLILAEEEFNKTLLAIQDTKFNHEQSAKLIDTLNSKIIDIDSQAELLNEKTIQGITNEDKISKLLNDVKEHSQSIEDKRSKIEAFHTNIENYEISIEKHKGEITQNIKWFKEEIGTKFYVTNNQLEESKKASSDIISQNEILQSQIKILLEDATAGKLYTEFRTESNKIKYELWFWLTGVITVNILLLTFSLIMIFGWKNAGIPSINLQPISTMAIAKFFLAIPILLLDWFVVKQYNIRRELMEKYTFKSLLAISLVQYNELVKQHLNNGETSAFIINSIEKIYSSPFEIPSAKATEAINNMTERGAGIIEKAMEKAIEKIKP